MTTVELPRRRETSRERALWFGLLGGGAAWFAQHALGYALVEVRCHSERLHGQVLGLEASTFLGALLTLAAAAVAIAAALAALRNLPGRDDRRFGGSFEDPERPGAPESRGRVWFMSHVGALLSALFLLAILTGGSSFFFMTPC